MFFNFFSKLFRVGAPGGENEESHFLIESNFQRRQRKVEASENELSLKSRSLTEKDINFTLEAVKICKQLYFMFQTSISLIPG